MGSSQNGFITVRVYYGSDQKSPFSLILYFGTDSTPASFSDFADELAEGIDAALNPPLLDAMAVDARYFGLTVAYKADDVVYTASRSHTNLPGNLAGDSLPDYAAVVLRKRTSHGGRTGYGRWYIGCVPESLTDTSRLNDDGRDAYGDLAEVLVNTYTAGGVSALAYHYSHKDDTFYAIDEWTLDANLGTQRRRLLRLPV